MSILFTYFAILKKLFHILQKEKKKLIDVIKTKIRV